MCVLTNERYKTYHMGFSFCNLGYAPGEALWSAGGAQWGQKIFYFFFKHGHLAYQIGGDDEQNRMQVKSSSLGQTGDLGMRSKGQISLNFDYHVNLNFLYQTLVCSHK